ncbi:MAG: DNA replication and repair protein RecF [Dysgonamonadaceae bacterium]|jgi:DNA replication and repair protein RecF|nr:DNA replication and repair protein RecF [Dysgonamonadaceae bacterium]
MIIERISILNFKNIEEADLTFSPRLNCLFGDNGMGKTNLLDALYYLSFTRSYTNLPDSQLITHEKDFMVLQGYYNRNDNSDEIYCGVKRKQKKVFKRNKKEYDRLSEHIGFIPVVIISPADIDLIQGGSDERRKFIDMLISQYDKEYLHALINYNKALYQRNSLLKKSFSVSDDSLFEIWEEQMSRYGSLIHRKRKTFSADFAPVFTEYYRIVSGENETVHFQYQSRLENDSLSSLLVSGREKDKISGFTTSGTHKDDFDFLLDDYLIRKIGSQGQNKTYLIALKLAQFNFLSEKGLSPPILLLDDLFDKLDAKRAERIIHLVAQPEFGQIFIADTNRNYPDEILNEMQCDYKLFQVKDGVIRESK